FAGRSEVPCVNGVWLAPVSQQMLVQSARPWGLEGRARRRVEEAARQSQGLPGRFTALLWGTALREDRPPRGRLIAAERSPAYGAGSSSEKPNSSAGSPPWPVPGELDALRRRMQHAIDEIARGRHTAGDRAIREVVGHLARRGDWSQAIKGTLALASSLLAR